jgi:hypothetical protein
LATLPDVMEDAVCLSNKILDLLAKTYPDYQDRITLLKKEKINSGTM